MLTIVEKIAFVLLAVGCVYFAYKPFKQMYDIIMQGKGEDKLQIDQIPVRLGRAIMAFLNQGQILRKGRTWSSIFHTGIAWGFIFYLLVNGVDTLEGYLPHDWHFWTGDFFVWGLYRLAADVLSVAVLVGMIYFLVRRFIANDKALTVRENVLLDPKAREGAIRRDSLIVGLFMLFHVGSRFFGAAANLAWHNEGFDAWQPFASVVANLYGSPEVASTMWHFFWWGALGSILLFLPYFPRTKHAHLFMGPLNFGTRPDRGALGAMNKIDFDDEEREEFGAMHFFDLSQTSIMDGFSCIMCNRCQDACPAYTTGKELSPAAIEINKRYYMKSHMDILADGTAEPLPLVGNIISESALWACTSCGACSDICPVGNEPMMDIMEMRRAQVLMEDSYPEELGNAFQGIERRGNPWDSTESRVAWAEGLPFAVPTVDENPDFEYLFWVGCAGAFDPNSQKTARAVATILNAAGVSFAILGDQETCTGDPARRAGMEYLFFEMASANVELLNEYGVDKKRIVTGCPHCLTSIGTEYKQFGGDYKVYHTTQMISDLVGKGKLKMNTDNQLEHVTFHDPCFLGRHNEIYDDPREALKQAGLTLLEMDRHGSKSSCCGAGGAQVWKEEEHGTEEVNVNRFEEAVETGAKTLAVGCPFCSVMMADAKGKVENDMEVKDVAEIIAERLA